MTDKKISQKFLNGLKQYQMEFEDIKDWIYCGGNQGSYYEYFKICYPDTVAPYDENCICGNSITVNCYIRENVDSPINDVLIVGSCCIRKFLPNGFTRFCENCNCEHKRIKHNICFECEKVQKEEIAKLAPYVYFNFPYDMKTEIKTNGAIWDNEYKLWRVNRKYKPLFIQKYSRYIIDDVSKFIADRDKQKAERQRIEALPKEYKEFAFAERQKAIDEGFRWDNNCRKWWKPIAEN
jgi:hypothetical protein